MKPRFLFILLLLFWFAGHASAQDYLFEFVEEHYLEKPIVSGGQTKVYHTWQIKTEYGAKLLVLVGDDDTYRQWLRSYLNNHVLFTLKIPDDGDDTFQYGITIPVNVLQIHPVYEDKWTCEKCRLGPPPVKDGQ